MDHVSLRAANAAVGNDPGAAALEVTLIGPELRVERKSTVAIAGADLTATLEGRTLPQDAPIVCDAGSVLRFGARRTGSRAYLAIEGGFAVTPVLGSGSTCVRAALGGFDGRPLRAADRLSAGAVPERHAGGRVGAPVAGVSAHASPTPTPAPRLGVGVTTLRVLRGPQHEWFDAGAFERLESERFTIQSDSDRMGFRLRGGQAIPRRSDEEMISDAAFTGAVQVPTSGQPILLMADRPTTGGYPQIAIVISADLPRAGQLMPGDAVRFVFCSLTEARAALRATPGGAAS
jgi:antagonist of KipI